ncbi:Isochorismatase [Segniliparus rotundus DSM 44985]|uniref:Isochorismatase n=1 Tax=Segniliparus rotundus (strain ATCC BAA-972 / CDC 1076 / CIP 108378 / DSM 44985 / JCM 13578) TaxID=640132 RepID=D6ZCJ1_SEGRD|nr:isochorismatase family protein [Segniliparus rotundus]ADG97033.1 Isochorismatase [Segniliparus rotundus DSM 44985]
MSGFRRRELLVAGSALAASSLAGVFGGSEAGADVRPTGSISYPLDGLSIPKSLAPWGLDRSRAVLLVHDMQHYFVKPYRLGSDPMKTVLANAKSLLDTARASGIPVLYSGQPGGMTPEQRGLFLDLYGTGMPDDDAERAIVPPLERTSADVFITKSKISAFFHTDLLDTLRSLGRDQLVIVGVYTFSGVAATSMDALQNDIETFIAADATADYTLDEHRQALAWCAARTARVVTAQSIATALR